MSKTIESRGKSPEKPVVVDDFVVEFRKYRTELTEKFKNRAKWTPIDPSKVLSFIPGTIAKIYVKEGDVVEPGTELMILEAFKMKNIVFSDVKGVALSFGLTIPPNVGFARIEGNKGKAREDKRKAPRPVKVYGQKVDPKKSKINWAR